MAEEKKKLIEVKNVDITFNAGRKNETKAVQNVSFDIYEGETFGLVGESGSGKTTIGRAIMKLQPISGGQILSNGQDIATIKKKADRKAFNKQAQMIFQDPQASLDLRMKVKDIVAEGVDANDMARSSEERDEIVAKQLETVGLNKEHANRYPHEFSGGQRQRIGIARALAMEPQFIIADEPISALDVSIQAQVVNLMQDLQKKKQLTYLFIAHDLSMVKYISDRIGVLHWGQMLEIGPADEIYDHPLHDYTRSLLSAIPVPDPAVEKARVPLVYDASRETDGQKRELVEIAPGHFVSATPEEIPMYEERAREAGLI